MGLPLQITDYRLQITALCRLRGLAAGGMPEAGDGQARGEGVGAHEAVRARLALPGDVVGRAVVGGSADDLEPERSPVRELREQSREENNQVLPFFNTLSLSLGA